MRHFIPFAALLALTACGSKEETTTVTTADGQEIKITSDADNNSESGTITFEGKDGEGKITFGDAAAKEGLPLGMPVYPGGEVKGAFMGGSEKEGSAGGMATVMTKDAPAKVVDFYKKEAEKRGLKIESQATSSANMASFTAKGANDSSLVVTATPSDEGGTAVVLIGGAKQ
ncbi:hypothetical protein [Sphingorhabdus contaminans]|uniref:Lipoprotein n=1 Tax=Sphingorhabdus contaminans TaxID=1343899 RepID=A0A553WI00_9SPHN|nr:hypothetical protein [Sphingorhabdus contaminans]TSB04330.1 hypothetical protein FOM92_02555 [Sphingorhabdus contaminans]